jgi:hypothetical protein
LRSTARPWADEPDADHRAGDEQDDRPEQADLLTDADDHVDLEDREADEDRHDEQEHLS